MSARQRCYSHLINEQKNTEFQTTLTEETEHLNLSLVNEYETFRDKRNLVWQFKCERCTKEISVSGISDKAKMRF